MSRRGEFEAGLPQASGFGMSGALPRSSQRQRVYRAEAAWKRGDAFGGQSISLQGARDLIGEILSHSSMDDLPGIREVRQRFDPSQIGFHPLSPSSGLPMVGRQWRPGIMGLTDSATGHVGLRPMDFEDFEGNPVQELFLGTASHEASHLVNSGQWLQNGVRVDHQWPYAAAHLQAIRNLDRSSARSLGRVYDASGVAIRPPD